MKSSCEKGISQQGLEAWNAEAKKYMAFGAITR
jgi:hypothetical protein